MKKKILMLLTICTLGLSCVGCGTSDASETESQETTSQSSQETEGKDDFIEVVDQNNMTAKVPKDASRVILTALPLPSIYAITGAPIENLVGMHPGATSAIENSVMKSMYPDLVNVPSNFVDGLDINIEEMMKLDPDVVVYWGDYTNQYDVMTEAGIPAVGVKTQAGGDALKTMESWLEIMGTMFGTNTEDGNASKVLKYGASVQEEIANIVNEIPENKKPKVLYIFGHSEDEISVSSTGHYGAFWIESAGGINAAPEITGTATVSMEQIYEWNPDVIIISTFTETTPEDLYNNVTNGQDWRHIAAVQNKKVYKEPLGTYRWLPPSGDAPLMAKWMAQTLHPDLFTYNMTEEIISYYKEFYQYDLTQEQAEGILEAVPEAAKGASFGISK